jgi:hypothetical protein
MKDYTLRFGYSPSASYGEAVRLASALPGYVVEESGRHARHTVPIDTESLPGLGPLLNIVRGWRSTELLASDVPQGAARLWALERVIACYQARELSGLEELHCRGFPGLGGRGVPCRLVDRSLPWAPGDEYRDQALLPRLLLAHARQAMAEVCPAYDQEAVMRALPAVLRRLQRQREVGGLTMQVSPIEPRAEIDERARIERLLRGVDFGEER